MSIFSRAKKYRKPSRSIDEKVKLLNKDLEKTGVVVSEDAPANSSGKLYATKVLHVPAIPEVISDMPDNAAGFLQNGGEGAAGSGVEGDPSTWDNDDAWRDMSHLRNSDTLNGVANRPVVATADLSSYDGLTGGPTDGDYVGYVKHSYTLNGTSIGTIGPDNKYFQLAQPSISGGTQFVGGDLDDDGNIINDNDRGLFQSYRGTTDDDYKAMINFKKGYQENNDADAVWKTTKCWIPFNSYGFGTNYSDYSGIKSGGYAYVNVSILLKPNKYKSQTFQPATTNPIVTNKASDVEFHPIEPRFPASLGMDRKEYEELQKFLEHPTAESMKSEAFIGLKKKYIGNVARLEGVYGDGDPDKVISQLTDIFGDAPLPDKGVKGGTTDLATFFNKSVANASWGIPNQHSKVIDIGGFWDQETKGGYWGLPKDTTELAGAYSGMYDIDGRGWFVTGEQLLKMQKYPEKFNLTPAETKMIQKLKVEAPTGGEWGWENLPSDGYALASAGPIVAPPEERKGIEAVVGTNAAQAVLHGQGSPQEFEAEYGMTPAEYLDTPIDADSLLEIPPEELEKAAKDKPNLSDPALSRNFSDERIAKIESGKMDDPWEKIKDLGLDFSDPKDIDLYMKGLGIDDKPVPHDDNLLKFALSLVAGGRVIANIWNVMQGLGDWWNKGRTVMEDHIEWGNFWEAFGKGEANPGSLWGQDWLKRQMSSPSAGDWSPFRWLWTWASDKGGLLSGPTAAVRQFVERLPGKASTAILERIKNAAFDLHIGDAIKSMTDTNAIWDKMMELWEADQDFDNIWSESLEKDEEYKAWSAELTNLENALKLADTDTNLYTEIRELQRQLDRERLYYGAKENDWRGQNEEEWYRNAGQSFTELEKLRDESRKYYTKSDGTIGDWYKVVTAQPEYIKLGEKKDQLMAVYLDYNKLSNQAWTKFETFSNTLEHSGGMVMGTDAEHARYDELYDEYVEAYNLSYDSMVAMLDASKAQSKVVSDWQVGYEKSKEAIEEFEQQARDWHQKNREKLESDIKLLEKRQEAARGTKQKAQDAIDEHFGKTEDIYNRVNKQVMYDYQLDKIEDGWSQDSNFTPTDEFELSDVGSDYIWILRTYGMPAAEHFKNNGRGYNPHVPSGAYFPWGKNAFMTLPGDDIGDIALNDGPSTPVKYDKGMDRLVPNMGGGRPGNIRPKGSAAFPQASVDKHQTKYSALSLNEPIVSTKNNQYASFQPIGKMIVEKKKMQESGRMRMQGMFDLIANNYPEHFAKIMERYPPDDQRLAELNWKTDEQQRASKQYMNQHFPLNRTLFHKVVNATKRTISLTHPSTFRRSDPEMTDYKKLMNVNYVMSKYDPNDRARMNVKLLKKKSAGRFLQKPKKKSKSEIINDKISALDVEMRKTFGGSTPETSDSFPDPKK